MATERPRQLLGLPVQRLQPGMRADLVLFDLNPDGGLQVKHVVIGGRVV